MTPIPSPRSKRRARIEIIPLIDIIFFLLATFVMVSLSMVKSRAIPVNLPAASTAAAQEPGDFATISIDPAGALFFDKKPVDVAGLTAALQDLLAANPDPRVFIHGDAAVPFGKAIAILDQVRSLGITKVAIETQPKPAAAAPSAP
jgi:biopolymer transport protein ExbD